MCACVSCLLEYVAVCVSSFRVCVSACSVTVLLVAVVVCVPSCASARGMSMQICLIIHVFQRRVDCKLVRPDGGTAEAQGGSGSKVLIC